MRANLLAPVILAVFIPGLAASGVSAGNSLQPRQSLEDLLGKLGEIPGLGGLGDLLGKLGGGNAAPKGPPKAPSSGGTPTQPADSANTALQNSFPKPMGRQNLSAVKRIGAGQKFDGKMQLYDRSREYNSFDTVKLGKVKP